MLISFDFQPGNSFEITKFIENPLLYFKCSIYCLLVLILQEYSTENEKEMYVIEDMVPNFKAIGTLPLPAIKKT